jgi:serine/threonine-protein kinase
VNVGSPAGGAELPLELARRVDQVCTAFEAAWKTGQRPRIEDYLPAGPAADRAARLRELVPLEAEYRRRAGDDPQPEEYARRFPDLDPAWLAAAVAAGRWPVSASDPACTVHLEVIAGPHRGTRLEFDRHETVLVGRGSRARLWLVNDPHFSRSHFLLEVNPPRALLRDLGSRNGTLVNDQRVRQCDLNPGDVISGGQTRIRFTATDAADAVDTAGPVSFAAPAPRIEGPAAPAIPGYKTVRKLGQGGMGAVYQARHLASGEPVALKVIIPEAAASERMVNRFLREARVLSRLDHPRIVRFREMGVHLGQLYIAMEYVETAALGEVLAGKSSTFRLRLCTALVDHALEGLHHAHGQGFVHRDVKPGNLLIERNGPRVRVKVADFGLAKNYEDAGLSGMTRQGEGLGTVCFMAPEQVAGARDARPAVDVYGAAATLYHMLSGAYPYEFPRGHDPFLVVLEAPVVPLTRRCPGVPAALADVVHRALTREPEERWPTAEALRQALLPFTREKARE